MELDCVSRDLELSPLSYHRKLADYLRVNEVEVWDWANSAQSLAEQADEVRDAMLRQTYRLEEGSHPAVFAACAKATQALDIAAPFNLYQAADGAMNASLYYVPGEIHLVFSGPTLERLSETELLALFGHELAHYKLWSSDAGAYYVASRVMELALTFPDVKPAHRETARLLSLHTELYADRGAVLAVGDLAPAVSMLVKVMTGLGTVDPAAYLRQARELEESKAKSAGLSHPESFLRARALELWWEQSADLDGWIEQRLLGPLSIASLDLIRQQELSEMTRGFLAAMIKASGEAGEAFLPQIRAFFPQFSSHEPALDLATLSGERIDDATRDYLIALMFDCAMADPDASDVVMAAAARTAITIGAQDRLVAALRRDLKWTKRAADALLARANKAA